MTEREVAIDVAIQAGKIMTSALLGEDDIEIKGHQVDLVTVYDKKVEAYVMKHLKEAFPQYGFLCEESGLSEKLPAGRWIIDPIDGTTRFSHGHPNHCVSIALEKQGRVVLGVVYAPVYADLYVAEEGGGASCNGVPIHVSSKDQLIQSLVATGWPVARYTYERGDRLKNNLAYFEEMLFSVQDIGRHGSAAIDICWVARGTLEAYFEQGLGAWDFAAAMLVLREAGGAFTYYGGSAPDFAKDFVTGAEKKNVVATNGKVDCLSVLRAAEKREEELNAK